MAIVGGKSALDEVIGMMGYPKAAKDSIGSFRVTGDRDLAGRLPPDSVFLLPRFETVDFVLPHLGSPGREQGVPCPTGGSCLDPNPPYGAALHLAL